MSRLIQHRRGNESEIPTLADGEIGITKDSQKLFYGMNGDNIEVAKKSEIGDIASQLADIVVQVENFKRLTPEVDDTARIQRAVDSLTSGGTLLFSKPTTISNTISLPDNIEVRFNQNAIISVTSGQIAFAVGNNNVIYNPQLKETRAYSASINNTYGISISGKSNVKIFGGKIDGFTFTNLGVSNSSWVSVIGLSTVNAGTMNTGTGECAGDGISIALNSQHLILSGITATNNGRHGIQSWSNGTTGLSSQDVTIVGCDCNANGDTGIQITYAQYLTITGNTCKGNGINTGLPGGQGIQIVGASTANVNNPKVITVSGNTCDGNTENGIELKGSTDVTLTGNTITASNWDGIKVWDSSANIVIDGNTVNRNGINGINVLNGDQIHLGTNTTVGNNENGQRFATCTNSHIGGFISNNNGKTVSYRSGVSIEGGSEITVTGGQSRDTQSNKTQQYGIRFYNVSGGGINNVRGTGNLSGLIQVDGGSTGILVDQPRQILNQTIAPAIGVNNTFIYSNFVPTAPSFSIDISKVKFTFGGTFGTNESVTARIIVNYNDGTSALVDKTATATGTQYLTDDDILLLMKNNSYIVYINFAAKTTLASTTVTVNVQALGVCH